METPLKLSNIMQTVLSVRTKSQAKEKIALERTQLQALLLSKFAFLRDEKRTLFRGAVVTMTVLGIGGALHLMFARAEYLLAYMVIVIPALLCFFIWCRTTLGGVPYLPIFCAQQGLVYSLPLVMQNETIEPYNERAIVECSLAVAALLFTSLLFWWLSKQLVRHSAPSRRIFTLLPGPAGDRSVFRLALLLLVTAISVMLASRSGLLWQIFENWPGLLPVITAFSNAAALLGAFIGGIAVSSSKSGGWRISYWLLIFAAFALAIADVLISAGVGMLAAAGFGLLMGGQRIPWKFLIVAGAGVAFLNMGKLAMRERYWSVDANIVSVGLTGIPSFYAEWLSTCAENVWPKQQPRVRRSEVGGGGQSALIRINNLQNLAFVRNAIYEKNIAVLYGETYMAIPALLIPRFLWAEKPRTHEGQVILNMHFERQSNMQDTFKAYIAWGLLPESVGNFGLILGPLLLGAVMGTLCGILEMVSLRKTLYSAYGMTLVSMLLILATSYEMVASILVTAAFQACVAVLLVSAVLQMIHGASPQHFVAWGRHKNATRAKA